MRINLKGIYWPDQQACVIIWFEEQSWWLGCKHNQTTPHIPVPLFNQPAPSLKIYDKRLGFWVIILKKSCWNLTFISRLIYILLLVEKKWKIYSIKSVNLNNHNLFISSTFAERFSSAMATGSVILFVCLRPKHIFLSKNKF